MTSRAELLSIATHAARVGGETIVAAGRTYEGVEKGAGDYVTAVDGASERAIAGFLTDATPDIPLVGEENIAAAVRAVADLPRARCLVLAGSIMGGMITEAVRELREHGVPVIALNMVGSVTDAADLVVSDPVQAGTMAVMAIADTAQFDLARQRGRRY